jgi:hypothetical protein
LLEKLGYSTKVIDALSLLNHMVHKVWLLLTSDSTLLLAHYIATIRCHWSYLGTIVSYTYHLCFLHQAFPAKKDADTQDYVPTFIVPCPCLANVRCRSMCPLRCMVHVLLLLWQQSACVTPSVFLLSCIFVRVTFLRGLSEVT